MKKKNETKSTNKNHSADTAKKLRIKFLILMVISACSAGLILHFLVPGTPLFVPWVCTCAVSILTFLISGCGLFTNLWQCFDEKEKEKE